MGGLAEIIEALFMIVLFVGIGLLFGIVGWKKKQYAKMYGGFGHFAGVLLSWVLSILVSLDDSSKGIAIMFFYPLFAGGGWLIGLHFGKEKDKHINSNL
ncbi:hypothetical protein [Bacillus salipaludis]|uniref:Uncharacterized protein n=1 Tax=Bacillus salipaludis TaxID=2547811 RepID=A0ABW8RJH3_9BACI